MDESIVRHLEQPQVGKLRLSEAIRIGARIRPQFRGGDYFGNGGSCAIGAAFEALTGKQSDLCETPVHKLTGVPRETLHYIIEQNDHQGLTCEQIADWLAAQGL